MFLYEKFGIPQHVFLSEEIEYYKKSLQRHLKSPDDLSHVGDFKASAIFDSNMLCFHYYFTDEKKQIEKYAQPMLDYAMDLFFGDWRNEAPWDGKIGAEYWKRDNWIGQYREVVLWGACIGEWDKVKEISKYPDELTMAAQPWETKEKKAWYTVLAIYLRDESLKNADKYIKIIEAGKKKREKLLLSVLRAIIDKNTGRFDKEFRVYLKYYKAHEYPQHSYPDKLAIDGTIMFNIAKHQGMNVEFPKEYIDHYIFLE